MPTSSLGYNNNLENSLFLCLPSRFEEWTKKLREKPFGQDFGTQDSINRVTKTETITVEAAEAVAFAQCSNTH